MNAFNVNVNTIRNIVRTMPEEQQANEARIFVKSLLFAGFSGISDETDIPATIVNDAAVKRFMEIEPPIAAVIPEFQEIIDEIEYSYVAGLYFAAVSAACVSIERLLNLARIELHPYEAKIKNLWGKGPSNSWGENIDALSTWGYIDAEFAGELNSLYEDVRCRYLHSRPIRNLAADAHHAVRSAYRLLRLLLGFPDDLFQIADGRMKCLNLDDSRYKAFYAKHVVGVE